MAGKEAIWRRGEHRLPPAAVMFLVLLLILFLQAASAYMFTQQPWTGLRLAADTESGSLRVESVAKNSPAEGLIAPGTLLTAVQSEGQSIPLTPRAVIDPKELRNHAEYAESMALQGQLHNAFKPGQPLTFMGANGESYRFVPRQQIPLRAIPWHHWALWTLGCVGLLLAGLVWSYQSLRIETLFLLISGLGYYGLASLHIIISSRELLISPEILHWLNVSLASFIHLLIFGFSFIHLIYPVRLVSTKSLYLGALIDVLLCINYYHQYIELPLHDLLIQYIPYTLIAIIFAHWQWKVSKGHPLDRAALLLLQISVIFPVMTAVLFYVVPLALNQPPLLSHNMVVYLCPPAVFAGWAVATLRYRLFQIEYWWFKSWLWILTGVLVILFDLILVTLFYTPQLYALGLSMLLVAFVYFPLRQWLLSKFMPLEDQTVQNFLPVFEQLMQGAVSSADFEQRWQTVLQQRFHPVHLKPVAKPAGEARLLDNGLHLQVPTLNGAQSYHLTGKNMAARLFNKADLRAIDSLRDIARITSTASDRRKEAVLTERRRIMHDLHDTIGARLLSLAYTIKSPMHSQSVRNTLQMLRDMIRLYLQEPPSPLEEHQADWRADLVELSEDLGVKLSWDFAPSLASLVLPVKVITELNLFVNDTCYQMLGNSRNKRLEVVFSADHQHLDVHIQDDTGMSSSRRFGMTPQTQ